MQPVQNPIDRLSRAILNPKGIRAIERGPEPEPRLFQALNGADEQGGAFPVASYLSPEWVLWARVNAPHDLAAERALLRANYPRATTQTARRLPPGAVVRTRWQEPTQAEWDAMPYAEQRRRWREMHGLRDGERLATINNDEWKKPNKGRDSRRGRQVDATAGADAFSEEMPF